MNFNRDKFFKGYREKFGSMSQEQVGGLNDLLSFIEADRHIDDVRWVAYMLATALHETARTFLPIHEYGSRSYFIGRYGGQTKKGKELGNDTPEEGATYAGKGFVQITGEYNYEKAEKDLRQNYADVVRRFESRTGKKFDLTVGDQPNDATDPSNAMDAEIAYAIMSNGMRLGRFTGKALADYISGGKCDYVNARRVINGLDQATAIAKYAEKFEVILKGAAASDEDEDIQRASPVALPPSPELASNESGEVLASNEASEQHPAAEAGSEASETPTTAEVSIKDGNITAKTSDAPTPPQTASIEKPEPKGFVSKVTKKITGLAGGNLTVDVATEKLAQAQALGLSHSTWKRIFFIILIASAIYLLYLLVNHILEVWRDKSITTDLILANTTSDGTVKLVDAGTAAKGEKVVTR